MSFGNNLRLIRKEKGLTQEQLAEMLNVSRQAVSKWESDIGYPETEKLIIIAKELGISLDYLMDNVPPKKSENDKVRTDKTVVAPIGENKIVIKMFDGRRTVNCLSVEYSKIAFPAKNEPPYILCGVDRVGFFGAHSVILGWYDDEDSVKRELDDIVSALDNGERVYELKYYTDIKFSIFGTASRKNS